MGQQWARLMDPDFERSRKSARSRYTPRGRRVLRAGSRVKPPAEGKGIPEDMNIVNLLNSYRQMRREEEASKKPEMFVIK